MLSPEAPLDRIVSGLSRLGFTPEVSDHGDHFCVEMEVSEQPSVELWRAFLAVLETADWYGLVTTAERGQMAWAAVLKEAPMTDEAIAAWGHCRQLYGS